MSELTINKLIKLILAGVVIVVVILGLYFAMTSYVIPFFKGLGFGSEGPGGDVLGEEDVCEGKTLVGTLEKGTLHAGGFFSDNMPGSFFVSEGKKTEIFLHKPEECKSEKCKNEGVWFNALVTNYKIGKFEGNKIIIEDKKKKTEYPKLDGALIGGNEICKP